MRNLRGSGERQGSISAEQALGLVSGVRGGDDTSAEAVCTDTATLPNCLEERIIFVSSPASVMEAMRFVELQLAKAGPAPWAERSSSDQGRLIVGLDSEWRPSFAKGQVNKTSILQVAFPDQVIIFDLRWAGDRLDCKHREEAWALVERILHAPPLLKIGANSPLV